MLLGGTRIKIADGDRMLRGLDRHGRTYYIGAQKPCGVFALPSEMSEPEFIQVSDDPAESVYAIRAVPNDWEPPTGDIAFRAAEMAEV